MHDYKDQVGMARNSGNGSRREPRFDFNDGHDSGVAQNTDEWRLSAHDRLIPQGSSIDDEDTLMAAASGAGRSSQTSKARASNRSQTVNGSRKPRSNKRRSVKRRSFIGMMFSTFAVLAIWGTIIAGGVFAYHFAQLPPIDTLTVPKRPPNIAVLAADGSLLANKGDMGGQTVSIKDLPLYLPHAFVAIEDRRFYEHMGIDPMGIARALVRNLTARGVSQGGSTLTQQLAKNLFLTQDRTFSRKIQEVILSLWLEQNFTKNEILELYLNRVYFGAGAYGVEAASLRYFGKPAKDVTLAEAAMLAGLVQAPSRLSPTRNPQAAQARAQLVLANMAELGFVSDKAAKNALMTPAETVKPRGAGSDNYAADYVVDVLDDFIGTVETDIVVHTTIDRAMMNAGEQAITNIIAQKGEKARVSQGALVAMSENGAIRALIGGRSYAASQFNRATAARRQPGSAFKPFVYLSALEHGLTPSTLRDDAPINLNGWQPQNFSRRYSGPVTLTTALSHSLNTVVVRLAVEVGPRSVVETAQRLGIISPMQANATIALGTSEVSPLELTAAYVPFANGGIGVVPWIISDVKTTSGKLVYRRQPTDLGRVVSEQNVSMMNYMLHQVVASGSGRRAGIAGYEVAGKTGTSQEARDAWFVGYTSGLVTSVWLGNDNNAPTNNITGGTLPAEAWKAFMAEALANIQPAPLFGSPWTSDAPLSEMVSPSDEFYPGRPGSYALPSSVSQQPVPIPAEEKTLFERLFGG